MDVIRTVTVTLPLVLSDIIASLVEDRARLNIVARFETDPRSRRGFLSSLPISF
jgi:hypothetical protein